MTNARHFPARRKYLAAVGSVLCAIGLTSLAATPAQASAVLSAPHVAAPHVAASDVTASDVTASDVTAASTPATYSPVIGGTYAALTPGRILDTRTGLGGHGQVGANQTVDLQVTGHGGVPGSGVAAVVINVTVTAPTAGGYITVYPSHHGRPFASNLNYVAGQTVSNLVTVPVGSDGKIQMTSTSSGKAQLVGDVQGYFRAGQVFAPGTFHSLAPARVLDTRNNIGVSGKVAAQGTIGVQATGRGGVPTSGVSAVVLNVTVTAPTASGSITAYPTGTSRPFASNLNFVAGQTVPNLVIVPVGSGGKIELINSSAGQTHLIADVQGYFLAGSTPSTGVFRALAPSRILDTRSGQGGSHRAAAGGETRIHVNGRGGVPAIGVSAVVVNVTATGASASGNLVAYPTGVAKPYASNLNFKAAQNVPNLVIVPVDSYGWISLSNNSTGSTDEIADVAGYFIGGGTEPTILGPNGYGPFTMGMTAAQAKAVYPQLNVQHASGNPSGCWFATTEGAGFTFNKGTTALSFITPQHNIRTGDGIAVGQTVGSVLDRFPWTGTSPDYPDVISAVTQADSTKPYPQAREYWMTSSGPRGSDGQVLRNDTIHTISLNLNEGCFD
ncbi:hypothetical protein ABIB25_003652 [Nakamurella sp. UYEF19]